MACTGVGEGALLHINKSVSRGDVMMFKLPAQCLVQSLEDSGRLLRQSARLDPKEFFADIQLGNVCLKRGSRENALRAYSDALQHAPNDPELVRSIVEQIRRVSSEPLGQVPELRDPFME